MAACTVTRLAIEAAHLAPCRVRGGGGGRGGPVGNNRMLLDRTAARAEDAAVRRAEEDADKVRNCHDFRDATRSWKDKERRVVARIEAPLFSREGAGRRHALCRDQPLRHAPLALRSALLRPRPGREPDQGAQTPSRLGPHLVQQGDGPASSSTPPPTGCSTPSRAAHPRPRSGAVPRSTRSATPSRDRRPRHRTRRPHRGLAAVELPPTSRASPASPATPRHFRPDLPGEVPVIEPTQPTANAAIEDRKRASSATVTHARSRTQNCPP